MGDMGRLFLVDVSVSSLLFVFSYVPGTIHVLYCYLVPKSCPTPCDSMDCSPQDSSIQGISQARILEQIAIFFSRGSSQTRDQTCVSCISKQILYLWATREALSARAGDAASIPGSRRSLGIGNGNPLQCSCLENSTERGAWWATVHEVAKSQTQLSNWACTHVCVHTHIHTHTHIWPCQVACRLLVPWSGSNHYPLY